MKRFSGWVPALTTLAAALVASLSLAGTAFAAPVFVPPPYGKQLQAAQSSGDWLIAVLFLAIAVGTSLVLLRLARRRQDRRVAPAPVIATT